MSQTNLTQRFNKFAGKEVQATEIINQTKYGTCSHVEVASSDPVVAELKKEAAEAGLNVRLWAPGIMGTMDYRTDRLNAHVEKSADGKYRIRSSFTIG